MSQCCHAIPKDPNCEVCRMTWTTRARCRHRPLRRAGEKPLPATFGKQIAAAHAIFNLDNESKNDHRNDLIAQDEYSYWIQISLAKKQRCTRTSILLAEIPASIPKTRMFHMEFRGVHQNAPGSAMDASHEYSTWFRDHGDRSCSTSNRRNNEKAMFQGGLPDDKWYCAMES